MNKHYKEALTNEDSDQWKCAMEKELESLKRNEVWELIDKPEAPVNIIKVGL